MVAGFLLLLALLGILAWLGLRLMPAQQPAALTLAEGSAADSPLPPALVEPLPERPTLSGYFFGWHPNGRQVLFWAGN